MIRSKFISVTLAAFCGLAFQLQASAANAQSQANTANANSVILLPGKHLMPGMGLRSPNGHSLVLQADGNVVLYTSKHVTIWSCDTSNAGPNGDA
jgi:hypothetical protein